MTYSCKLITMPSSLSLLLVLASMSGSILSPGGATALHHLFKCVNVTSKLLSLLEDLILINSREASPRVHGLPLPTVTLNRINSYDHL